MDRGRVIDTLTFVKRRARQYLVRFLLTEYGARLRPAVRDFGEALKIAAKSKIWAIFVKGGLVG